MFRIPEFKDPANYMEISMKTAEEAADLLYEQDMATARSISNESTSSSSSSLRVSTAVRLANSFASIYDAMEEVQINQTLEGSGNSKNEEDENKQD
ncbi:hypothetical protein Mgra_00008859 [Meloidogyne graminicola]|uniref:Uncharacterized protein n=1 Tax=Meloidogyne graminicola TaxID=189291 RepID=A0A8S9ZEL4_9BILA|nr:hypothetical protein Mgra_00008859 [Meloidogyne graminicola]